jgi:hypothetical protein
MADKEDESFDYPISLLLRQYVLVMLGSGSGNFKLSTVTSVNLRILEMSSMPPSLKLAVILLLSRITSVTWTKVAFEAAWVKVGNQVVMVAG